jgi:soluble lytic murein transglycosylase
VQQVRAGVAAGVALTLLVTSAPLPMEAQRGKPAKVPSGSAQKPAAKTTKAPAAAASEPLEKQLAGLARGLRDADSPAAYAALRDFANRHVKTETGARAALALAYYDYTKDRFAQAESWIQRAGGEWPKGAPHVESPLAEYVLYWKALIARGLGHNADALGELEQFRRSFPDSAVTEAALQALAEIAVALNQPERALAALNGYGRTESRPTLLLWRAQAQEKLRAGPAGSNSATVAAAKDYQAVYYRFPLTEEARAAGVRLDQLERGLGTTFPAVPLEQRAARADALYDARRWREAREEYESMLPLARDAQQASVAGRASLHIARARVELGGPIGILTDFETKDAELDAERLYLLAQAYRSRKAEDEALATVDQLAKLYPQSHWTAEGLFTAGNILWVRLDRKHAAEYYRRVVEQFPGERNVQVAHWRMAWTAYLDRAPETARLLEEHIRRFPSSPALPDALYWLGRQAERSGNAAHARSFYLKARERFPQTYFGMRAADRLKPPPDGLGTEPLNSADFLDQIPAPPPLPSLEEPLPQAAAARWARAEALRSIAFDASAELELRAAFAETGARRLLWEVAKSAIDSGRYAAGIVAGRQVFPQLEARKLSELPSEVWKTLYPLPYESSLRRAAARNAVDPMFVAALIRQESVFQPEAVSHAGAVGLMQVLPKTGRQLARRSKLPYSRARLFKPEYNLQLGSLYLSDLLKQFNSPEAVLAAFNAGEDRVVAWQAERSYEHPAEFAESIPFTETREYVQIVMRNAELYRHLYARPAGGLR